MDRLPGQNFNKREREDYRARAVVLLIQGKTEREVAAELGISHSSVGRLWIKQRERWADEHEALVERELEKLDYIEAEHWKAYQESRAGPDGDVKALAPVGEPEHLGRVLAVMQERARRLGLYSPHRVTATVRDELPAVRHIIECPPGGDSLAYLQAIQLVLELNSTVEYDATRPIEQR